MLAWIHLSAMRRGTAGVRGLGILATLATLLVAATAGCSKPVDLSRSLHAMDVATGWFDAGIFDGKNKLVPSITFKLHNASSRNLVLQMNVMFMIPPEQEAQDEVFLQAIEVPPSGTSKSIVVRAKYGFTGEQPRAEMLQHRQFRDFSVRLFAKQGSGQWTLIGEHPVKRQLLIK